MLDFKGTVDFFIVNSGKFKSVKNNKIQYNFYDKNLLKLLQVGM